MMSWLMVAACLGVTPGPSPAEASTQEAQLAPEGPAPTPSPEAKLAPSVLSETPPPSAWDRQRQGAGGGEAAPTEERSLMAQMLRSLFGLLVVVGLIYLLGKLAAMKLGRNLRLPGRGDRRLELIERLSLDARHSLFLVQIKDGPKLLLGTGEKGMRAVWEGRSADDSPGTAPAFGETFTQVAAAPRKLSEARGTEGSGHGRGVTLAKVEGGPAAVGEERPEGQEATGHE